MITRQSIIRILFTGLLIGISVHAWPQRVKDSLFYQQVEKGILLYQNQFPQPVLFFGLNCRVTYGGMFNQDTTSVMADAFVYHPGHNLALVFYKFPLTEYQQYIARDARLHRFRYLNPDVLTLNQLQDSVYQALLSLYKGKASGTNNPLLPQLSIEVYPNPAQSGVSIICDLTIESVTILTPDGKNLGSIAVNRVSDRIWYGDIASLPDGVYFLRISTSKGQALNKLIKQSIR